MLITFSTDAYANITMFGDIGLSMLKMMGHSATVPGAILAADVPLALSKLTAAIDTAKTVPPVYDKKLDDAAEQKVEISMATRALPLIQLLTSAVKEKSDVMWK